MAKSIICPCLNSISQRVRPQKYLINREGLPLGLEFVNVYRDRKAEVLDV